MARVRMAVASMVLAGVLAPALAGAQTIRLMHFLPVADMVTTSTFSCAGATGEQVDGSVRYRRHRDAGFKFAGGFEQVTLKGQAIDAALLARANAIVGSKHIETVSPGCQEDGAIQLLVGLWDASQAEGQERSIFAINRGPDGTVSVDQ